MRSTRRALRPTSRSWSFSVRSRCGCAPCFAATGRRSASWSTRTGKPVSRVAEGGPRRDSAQCGRRARHARRPTGRGCGLLATPHSRVAPPPARTRRRALRRSRGRARDSAAAVVARGSKAARRFGRANATARRRGAHARRDARGRVRRRHSGGRRAPAVTSLMRRATPTAYLARRPVTPCAYAHRSRGEATAWRHVRSACTWPTTCSSAAAR